MADYNRFTRRQPGVGVQQPTRRVPGGVRTGPATFRKKGPPGPGFRPAPRTQGPPGPGFRPDVEYPFPIDTADALAAARAAIGDQFDAEAAKLMAEYNSRMAGIGSGAGAAIREAQDVLKDVQGNRAALKDVYAQYDKIVDPLAQEALDAAKALVGEVTPEIEAIAQETAEGIAADYAEAEVAISEAASLIGAGGAAARSVQVEASESEAILQEHAAAEAEDNLKLLKLEGEVATTGAIAAQALDEGQMTRRALLQDMSFQAMEEQAQAALAAARRAAAAAASRRAAIAGERNAALAELEAEKYAAMTLNPHEAGEITAIEYLRQAGSGLDYNRQQLVFNTLSNAISQQVPAGKIDAWVRDSGLTGTITNQEKRIVQGALRSYTNGMRAQQDIDRGGGGRGRANQGAYNWRTGRRG